MNQTSGCPVLKFQKRRTGWPHPGVLPKISKLLNKKGYLGNFNKDSCGIKILYGMQEEGMGVQEEFVHFLYL